MSLLLIASCAGEQSPPSATVGAAHVDTDAQLLEKWKSDIAVMYQINNPPTVEPVRTVTSEDADALIDECVAERGFQKESDGMYRFTEEQHQEFNLAKYVCTMSYPPKPESLRPLSDAQKRQFYRWVVSTEIPCLTAEGFTIVDVPSEDSFVSMFDTNTWYPYTQVLNQLGPSQETPEFQRTLNAKCPQWPPAEVLLGSPN